MGGYFLLKYKLFREGQGLLCIHINLPWSTMHAPGAQWTFLPKKWLKWWSYLKVCNRIWGVVFSMLNSSRILLISVLTFIWSFLTHLKIFGSISLVCFRCGSNNCWFHPSVCFSVPWRDKSLEWIMYWLYSHQPHSLEGSVVTNQALNSFHFALHLLELSVYELKGIWESFFFFKTGIYIRCALLHLP